MPPPPSPHLLDLPAVHLTALAHLVDLRTLTQLLRLSHLALRQFSLPGCWSAVTLRLNENVLGFTDRFLERLAGDLYVQERQRVHLLPPSGEHSVIHPRHQQLYRQITRLFILKELSLTTFTLLQRVRFSSIRVLGFSHMIVNWTSREFHKEFQPFLNTLTQLQEFRFSGANSRKWIPEDPLQDLEFPGTLQVLRRVYRIPRGLDQFVDRLPLSLQQLTLAYSDAIHVLPCLPPNNSLVWLSLWCQLSYKSMCDSSPFLQDQFFPLLYSEEYQREPERFYKSSRNIPKPPVGTHGISELAAGYRSLRLFRYCFKSSLFNSPPPINRI